MGIQQEVLRYFEQYPGMLCHLDDIAEETGFTNQQISGAITHLRRNPNYLIDRPTTSVYVYRGLASPNNLNGDTPNVSLHSAARVVAVLRSGTLLIEVEGILYSAKEISLE